MIPHQLGLTEWSFNWAWNTNETYEPLMCAKCNAKEFLYLLNKYPQPIQSPFNINENQSPSLALQVAFPFRRKVRSTNLFMRTTDKFSYIIINFLHIK